MTSHPTIFQVWTEYLRPDDVRAFSTSVVDVGSRPASDSMMSLHAEAMRLSDSELLGRGVKTEVWPLDGPHAGTAFASSDPERTGTPVWYSAGVAALIAGG